MVVVPGHGPTHRNLMIVAEAPGAVEAQLLKPLVGPSGRALGGYLNRANLDRRDFYLTNVVKLYREGNPDPDSALIDEWAPDLLREIEEVRPQVIIALGRFATRFFLGAGADMDVVRGIPHSGGEFEHVDTGDLDAVTRRSCRDRAMGAVVIPTFHPAHAFRFPAARTLIDLDIRRAADIIRLIRGGRRDLVPFRRDSYAGRERYSDVSGAELARIIRRLHPEWLAVDTEGDPDDPFSIQISPEPGVAYMLRASRDRADLGLGIAALREAVDRGCVIKTHDAGTPRGTGYDTQVCRVMGLELRDARFSNTMYRAFTLRTEPRGLKALLWRFCGMRQAEYESLIAGIGRERQVDYLRRVAARKDWERVQARVEPQNNGTLKLKKFGKLESRAGKILTDIDKDKRNKDGEPVDPEARWAQLEPELREVAERELGKLPRATLHDVPLDEAVAYGCADACGTGRLDLALEVECRRLGVEGVCQTGFEVLPIFEQMQHDGMPASRRAFVSLASRVRREMEEIQAGLSVRWFDGRPFNPAPNTKDVEALVQRLGVPGLKKTRKSGKTSTSMKSLEYLAPKYPALAEVGEWRRRQKVLHTYCLPLIEIADRQFEVEARRLGGGDAFAGRDEIGQWPACSDSNATVNGDGSSGSSDLFLVRCKLKPVSVETRRLAAEDPSLLNQPVRTELGRMVRACYMTVLPEQDDPNDPNVEVFGEWDFNSQEVRVVAHISEDRLLCEIMRDTKRKIHMETASRVFGKPIDQIDEVGEKIPAKTAFFGMLYGLTENGLLDLFRSFGLENWALDDCERLIAEIFRIYPGLDAARKRAAQEALRTGMVRDLYGHIRYLPGIWSNRRGERAEAARQAFSHWVQSTAQGLTQNAMASLRAPIRQLRPLGVKWALQVHDSVLMRFPRWLYPTLNSIMVEHMTHRYGGPTNVQFRVPILVDGQISTQWAGLKG